MENVEKEISKLNEYLEQYEWMDFSYDTINDIYIKIIGSTDLSIENYHSLELIFERPINILTVLSDWHKPEKKSFIELSSRKEAIDKLGVIGEEYHTFKINVDGYSEAPIWIVAKSFKCNILK